MPKPRPEYCNDNDKKLCCASIGSMSSNSNSKRENIEQIPKEEKIGEVQKAVSEQGGVEGQRKEVNIGDYVKAAALGQLLKNLEFPADKNKIIQFVQLQEQPINMSKEKKEDILYILEKNIKEGKQYQNVSEVTRATGIVQQ
jgi:hypothetical protein